MKNFRQAFSSGLGRAARLLSLLLLVMGVTLSLGAGQAQAQESRATQKEANRYLRSANKHYEKASSGLLKAGNIGVRGNTPKIRAKKCAIYAKVRPELIASSADLTKAIEIMRRGGVQDSIIWGYTTKLLTMQSELEGVNNKSCP